MAHQENFLVGIFDDEDVLLHAVENIREKGVRIKEVFSPFPVHGLDDALGYRRSRLPIAAFLFGMTGTMLALFTQVWMLGYDWPMIIGGKNHASLPPFIPVTFEFTVLLAAFGMVGTFLIVSDMKPYKWPRQYDIRSTNDKHVMAIDLGANKISKEEIQRILKDNGASEVNEKSF
ncbi:MAG TPA: DUF3341 domain-containing protein [Cyclobacteriaceae bacterium]|jgi:hypothetical protein|nr:DUF3341 domain-containing protein [Cyclobacteriaceae bacterium]HQQ97357.1 DUF3341 domain-containing protein [Cyclobacteriaceae bacterium]